MTTALVLACCVGVSDAEAQNDFGSVRLKPGDFVYVTDPAGVEVAGPIASLSPSSLSVAGYTFKPESGLKVERRGDRLWDGPVIGAAVGLGLGALLSTGECGADWSAWQCSLAGGAWGTVVGTLIDVAHKGRTVVFVGASSAHAAPTSGAAVARRTGSVSVRVSF